jgi:hypothetical protein
MDDSQIIGLGLVGFGSFFFLLGVLLLLDRALLIMSNLLIMGGIIFLMGASGFYAFVIQKGKAQGSIAFFLGIALILCKLPLPGILCEVVGAYWLFGGFWPMLLSLVMKLPYASVIFPFLSKPKDDEGPIL